jgi:glycosyltransferase involved in cell wall biosynthesis
MATPLFSIVTITLNCAEDAISTAKSVLAQKYSDYEYLVKDGGSQDDTIKCLRALNIAVNSCSDTGIYDAMNQSMEYCTGEYICFMNAGDTFSSDTVLQKVAKIISSCEPYHRAELYFGDILFLGPKQRWGLRSAKSVATGVIVTNPDRLNRFLLYRHGLCHQTWFMKRETYKRFPFNTKYQLLADYDLLLYQILIRHIRYSHIPVVTARYKAGGVSERNISQWALERELITAIYYSKSERALFDLVRTAGKRLLQFTQR